MTQLKQIHSGEQGRILKFLVSEHYSMLRRSLFFIVVLVFFLSSGPRNLNQEGLGVWRFNLGIFVALLGPISINVFFLIPKVLFAGRNILYIISVLGVLIPFYLILLWIWGPVIDAAPEKIPEEGLWFGAGMYLFILGILCAASAALKLFQKGIRDRYKITRLEDDLLHTQLQSLKANISPHFLFNMLNNTDVLIQTDPLKARQIIQKLSEFLRYQLYDSAREKVLLSADIRFIHHFLSLEKIRRDDFEFEIKEVGTEKQVEVSPLLFIPFVENAVKHNVNYGTEAYVRLSFTLNEKRLVFSCHNPVSHEQSIQQGGFGLPNVNRRLELLYPGRHELSTFEKDGIYSVILVLNL